MRWLLALVALGGCDRFLGLAVQPIPPDGPPDAPTTPCPGDTFDASTIDMTRWDTFTQSSIVVSQVNGQLDIALPANVASAYGGLTMLAPIGETASAQIELVQPATGSASEADLELIYSNGNSVLINQGYGALAAYVNNTKTASRPFDSARDRFLRIEYSNANLELKTSPDGASWITLLMTPAPPGPPTVQLVGGVYQPVPAATHVAFDNFEIVTPDCRP